MAQCRAWVAAGCRRTVGGHAVLRGGLLKILRDGDLHRGRRVPIDERRQDGLSQVTPGRLRHDGVEDGGDEADRAAEQQAAQYLGRAADFVSGNGAIDRTNDRDMLERIDQIEEIAEREFDFRHARPDRRGPFLWPILFQALLRALRSARLGRVLACRGALFWHRRGGHGWWLRGDRTRLRGPGTRLRQGDRARRQEGQFGDRVHARQPFPKNHAAILRPTTKPLFYSDFSIIIGAAAARDRQNLPPSADDSVARLPLGRPLG